MQQITLLGNVGRDAITRETNGRRAIGFSVAVNESYKDANGNKVENTTWYDCTIWREGQQSSKVADYLKRGQQVLIQGRPSVRSYQSQKDGKWYAALEVRVDKCELVGSAKPEAPASNPDQPVQVAEQPQRLAAHRDAPAATSQSGSKDDDNDLPF